MGPINPRTLDDECQLAPRTTTATDHWLFGSLVLVLVVILIAPRVVDLGRHVLEPLEEQEGARLGMLIGDAVFAAST